MFSNQLDYVSILNYFLFIILDSSTHREVERSGVSIYKEMIMLLSPVAMQTA
jgi:hypothetical protein